MNAQLWVTAVVAVLGYVATIVSSSLAGRNATKLALRLRNVDRHDARRTDYEACCREFLSAARVLRLAGNGTRSEDQASVLSELRRAAAGIELRSANLAMLPLAPALETIERLVRIRADGSWSASINEAEADCDRALDALRTAITMDLADNGS
jgi:hypothetical protein